MQLVRAGRRVRGGPGGAADAGGQHEHRRAVEGGLREPGEGVGHAGPADHVDARDGHLLPVLLRAHEAGREVPGALLIRDEDGGEPAIALREGLIQRKVLHAGDAEGVGDAGVGERLGDELSSRVGNGRGRQHRAGRGPGCAARLHDDSGAVAKL